MTTRPIARFLAAAALTAAVGGTQAQAAESAAALGSLLQQAEFWRSQNRLDMAMSAFERVLAVAPDNPDALAGAVAVAAQMGNAERASSYLNRLKSADPASPRQAEAASALRALRVDPAALGEARRLAREGQGEQAVARYRRLFGAEGPPPGNALEYYQTLAGTPGGFEEGRAGLAGLAARSPGNTRVQLALAEAMTWRGDTRNDGIERLQGLATRPEVSEPAVRAWRQALLWQAPLLAQRPALEAFLSRYPEDAAVRRRLGELRDVSTAPSPADQARIRGFEELNSNRLRDAEQGFVAALAARPNDADALGGLGVIRLREGRAAEARDLLDRAIRLAPDQRAQWSQALDGAGYAVEVQEARAAIRRGEVDAAESALRSAVRREVPDRADAEALLGDVALRRGDAAAAEALYRAALGRRPNFGAATTGLVQALRAQGRVGEAEQIARRAAPRENLAAMQATALRNEAEQASDPASRAALLRRAMAADPGNPWVRLDLARVVSRQGNAAEARALVETPLAQRPGADAAYAAALLAQEQGRTDDVTALLERVPAGQRSAEMTRLLGQAKLVDEVRRIGLTAGRSPEARQRLLAIASQRDPSGAAAAAAIRAFAAMGDGAGAAEAARLATAANPGAPPASRLAMAGALLTAGYTDAADEMARGLAAEPRLTQEQRRELAALRTGTAVRAADRLNEQGNQGQAYEQLAPVLAADPDNPGARLALARLHNGASQPEQASRIATSLLQRDPRNLDARLVAADAAIVARDRLRAEQLLDEGMLLHPNDPRVRLMEARIARAWGNDRRAVAALRAAAELRRIQLGQAQVAYGGGPAPGGNPFLRRVSYADGATGLSNSGLAPQPLQDQISRDIAQELAVAQEEASDRVQGGVALRNRSGTGGLDRLQEFGAPIEASIRSDALSGRLGVRVTPVTLSSGSLDRSLESSRSFGANAIAQPGGAARPRDGVNGVGLGVSYERRNATVDAGTSPLGFARDNVLGGIELSPRLTDNLRLRVTAERRSVTDSVLSWAGQKDDRIGRTWGGVVRTGGRAQLEYTTGPVTLYAGGGYSRFTGEGVAANSRTEGGAGVSYAVIRQPGEELTTGLDMVYMAYDNNQRHFTLGNGGYFSPQSFTAVNVPVDYRARWGDLNYRIGASLGYTNFREAGGDVFPNDPQLQRSLASAAAADPTVAARFSGQSRSGVVGGVRADGTYPLTDSLQIGASLRYDRAANWNETRGMVFLRHRLGGS